MPKVKIKRRKVEDLGDFGGNATEELPQSPESAQNEARSDTKEESKQQIHEPRQVFRKKQNPLLKTPNNSIEDEEQKI